MFFLKHGVYEYDDDDDDAHNLKVKTDMPEKKNKKYSLESMKSIRWVDM